MFCNRCDQKNADDSKYCFKCSMKLEKSNIQKNEKNDNTRTINPFRYAWLISLFALSIVMIIGVFAYQVITGNFEFKYIFVIFLWLWACHYTYMKTFPKDFIVKLINTFSTFKNKQQKEKTLLFNIARIILAIILVVLINLILSIIKEDKIQYQNKSSTPLSLKQPSTHDLELQQEGILDQNFKYANSLKVNNFYQQVTAEINKNNPMSVGNDIKLEVVIQMPGIESFSYSLPLYKQNFDHEKMKKYMIDNRNVIESNFCYQANKHIHYKVNNMKAKYIYTDINGEIIFETTLRANDCK